MLKMKLSDLDALFAKIGSRQDLILPIRKAGQTNFGLWNKNVSVVSGDAEGSEAADLSTLKTVKSGKDAFFPQSETLYTCVRDGKKLSVNPEELRERPFVVFGMRSCDAKGIEVLDQVFLTDPVDSFYEARRKHGTIVTLACPEPEESCFCKVYGIDPADPAGNRDKKEIIPTTDVSVWITDSFLYWQDVTDKGKELTESVSEFFTNMDESDEKSLRDLQERIRSIVELLPDSNLSLEGWNGEATDEKFNSPLWEDLYKPCLGCGTCTFVCPTCQCYDIKDYDTGHGVLRYRCWDSCMYSDFTMMAASNNRTNQMQRFRQRFMHKLVYFPANNDGMYSCVGCGRCVERCPEGLNIVKVIKAFAAERQKEEEDSASERGGAGE